MPRIGVDLGGTKIEIVALEDDGRELLRRRVATPQGDYRATIHAIAALVMDAERRLGMRGSVGVGTPGSASPASGLMRNANSTCLNGQALQADLEAALARPVRLANDANCLAMSEATDGAARDAGSVFAVILGTGVGGGLVVNGALLEGRNAVAGEWGHNPLPCAEAFAADAPACYCGRRGCIETYLSGPALAADHLRAGGTTLDAAGIAAAAAAGDALAAASLARYVERLARALASIINVVDPDVIVFGGGLSRIDALYRELPRRMSSHVFSDVLHTRVLPSLHGDASGVRGAACLWPIAGP